MHPAGIATRDLSQRRLYSADRTHELAPEAGQAMTLRVTFDLDDKDLKYFRSQVKSAQESAKRVSEEEVVEKASAMITEVADAGAPEFVMLRLERLRSLIEMLRDEEWALPAAERKNVVSALAYFANPQDLIPDDTPVLGYIDDAIMIELVVRELAHEIEAYDDFCRYRREEALRNRSSKITREEWLVEQRRRLHSRMRRRRAARNTLGSGNRAFRLF
jgi:uncharacterized membrane protein YkvA (DUF1232 family)